MSVARVRRSRSDQNDKTHFVSLHKNCQHIRHPTPKCHLQYDCIKYNGTLEPGESTKMPTSGVSLPKLWQRERLKKGPTAHNFNDILHSAIHILRRRTPQKQSSHTSFSNTNQPNHNKLAPAFRAITAIYVDVQYDDQTSSIQTWMLGSSN